MRIARRADTTLLVRQDSTQLDGERSPRGGGADQGASRRPRRQHPTDRADRREGRRRTAGWGWTAAAAGSGSRAASGELGELRAWASAAPTWTAATCEWRTTRPSGWCEADSPRPWSAARTSGAIDASAASWRQRGPDRGDSRLDDLQSAALGRQVDAWAPALRRIPAAVSELLGALGQVEASGFASAAQADSAKFTPADRSVRALRADGSPLARVGVRFHARRLLGPDRHGQGRLPDGELGLGPAHAGGDRTASQEVKLTAGPAARRTLRDEVAGRRAAE